MATTPLDPTDNAVSRRHRQALALVRPLGLAALLASVAVLLAYALHIPAGYRPWPGAPGTAPLTALTTLLLGLALSRHRPLRTFATEIILAAAALTLAMLRLAELSFGITLLPGASVQPLPHEPAIVFGWNSAFGAALCALTLLVRRHVRPFLAQALATLTLAVPLIAFVGYSYGLAHFYGQSSLYTGAILLVLASAATLTTARTGLMRMLLSPFVAGHMARLQLLGAFAIPYTVGGLLLQIEAGHARSIVGLGVVATAAFTALLMSLSLRALDRMDQQRRAAERATYFEATHDHLTGLANRRLFTDVAAMELTRAVRQGAPISLVMIDIDHFKAVNDSFGHKAGDIVLQRTARLIAKNVRGGDLPARLGGEEFAVLLPDTTAAEALTLAERLRAAVAQADFSAVLEKGRAVTISVGVARQEDHEDGLDALLRAADTALYTAKENGRNRVEHAAEAAAD